jgi:hypothetical protein
MSSQSFQKIEITVKNLAGELYPVIKLDPREIDLNNGHKIQTHIKNNLRRRDRELFNIHPDQIILTRLDDKSWNMATYPLTDDEMLFILVDPKFMVNLHGTSGSFPLNFPEHIQSDRLQLTENELKQIAHQQYPEKFRDVSLFRLIRDTERTFRKPLTSGEQVSYIIGDMEEIKTPDEEFDSLIRSYRQTHYNKERILDDLDRYLRSPETIEDIGEEKIIEEIMREYRERRRERDQSLPLCKVLLKYLPYGGLHEALFRGYTEQSTIRKLSEEETDILNMLQMMRLWNYESSSRFGGKRRSRSKKSTRKTKKSTRKTKKSTRKTKKSMRKK